MPETVIKAAR